MLLVVSVIVGARLLFANSIDTTYTKGDVVKSMGLLRHAPAPSVVHRDEQPVRVLAPGQTRLEAVISSGELRLCYKPDFPPFTYFNSRDELVGLDIEMGNSLARGLDVTLVFVPLSGSFGGSELAEALNSGYCDMSISFHAISMGLLGKVAYSDPYLDMTLAFIVEDHRRQEFKHREAIDRNPDLRIAFPDEAYYLAWARRLLPNAQILPVPNVETFLSAEEGEYDAMLFVGETLAAHSLLNPRFGVVVPLPTFPSVPAAYVLPLGESEWLDVINGWITLKQADGSVQELFDYWVLGKDAKPHEPRWSVIRDVLHWVD